MFTASTSRDLAVLVALVHVASTAGAQQADSARPVAQVEVTGKTASYDPRRDDTAMKIVVGREELDRYGDTNVLDVLKRVAGITVTSTDGRSGRVQMRGLGGYTQVLVNGERMPAGFQLDSLAPDLIERIEVMRAPTAEFSMQSVAGTINIVLRQSTRKKRREAKLGYQQTRELMRGPTAALDLAEQGDKFSYSLSANANHDTLSRSGVAISDEFYAPGGALDTLRATVLPERGRMTRFGLTPKLNWKFDSGDTLEWQTLLNGDHFRDSIHNLVTTPIGSPPPVPDLLQSIRDDRTMLRSDLKWTHAFASGTALKAKLGIVGMQDKNLQSRTGYDSADRLATDDRVQVHTRDRGVNSTGKITRQFEGGAFKGHALSLGWDGGVNWRDDSRHERDTVQPLPPKLFADADFDARITRLALYAQDEWKLASSVSAYLGVRWEGVQTDVSGTGFDPTRIRSSVWSPVAQAVWKIAESKDGKGDQVRAAVSRTYKAPDIDSLVPRRQTWENNSPVEADYQGNPNLKPELAWGLDFAWEHYWAEEAMVSVGASARRIGNYTSNRVFFDGYRWVMTPVNEDRARTRSLELETRFPLKTLWKEAPAFDLRASLSRNWSRVDSIPGPDNRMEQQVPLSAQFGLDWKAGRLTAGTSLAFKSAVQARVSLDRWAYTRARRDLEVYGLWKFTPKLQLRLAAANLLGEDFGPEIRYFDASGAVLKRRWLYPGGQRLTATLETSF